MIDCNFDLPLIDVAELRSKRDLGRIATYTDANQTVQIGLPRAVEEPPAAAQVGFEHGMEVTRFEAIGVAADKPRWDVESSTE